MLEKLGTIQIQNYVIKGIYCCQIVRFGLKLHTWMHTTITPHLGPLCTDEMKWEAPKVVEPVWSLTQRNVSVMFVNTSWVIVKINSFMVMLRNPSYCSNILTHVNSHAMSSRQPSEAFIHFAGSGALYLAIDNLWKNLSLCRKKACMQVKGRWLIIGTRAKLSKTSPWYTK